MKLSIITVTYNNENSIDAYLESILKNAPENCELIIIDNNSSDKTCNKILEFRKKNGIEIKLIESAENLGFSKANNIGAKIASSEILVFLNPDTKISQDSLGVLSDFVKKKNDAGIVAPAILRMNRNLQPTVRNLPTLKGALNEYLLGKKFAYSEYVPDSTNPIEVESVYGTCMAIRKNIFEKIGGFNEKYFLYYEDLDLCRKIAKENLKVYYVPQAKIQHVLGGSNDDAESKNEGGFLSEFFPMKNTERRYYQIQSSNIYHGFFIAFLIHLAIFLSQKFGKKH